ncbi:hypothetical protein EV424DRAFT_1351079 [Suillus variegatus]|nr:hypothetical protein EV424DRAFT_1351079 [Suillus variegatus]
MHLLQNYARSNGPLLAAQVSRMHAKAQNSRIRLADDEVRLATVTVYGGLTGTTRIIPYDIRLAENPRRYGTGHFMGIWTAMRTYGRWKKIELSCRLNKSPSVAAVGHALSTGQVKLTRHYTVSSVVSLSVKPRPHIVKSNTVSILAYYAATMLSPNHVISNLIQAGSSTAHTTTAHAASNLIHAAAQPRHSYPSHTSLTCDSG